MKTIRISILFAAMFFACGINAAPLSTLVITGGSFNWGGIDGTISPAAYAEMALDGSYYGNAPSLYESLDSISIATGEFGLFGPMSVFTSEFDTVGNGPFAAVSGDLTGSDLTLDLSSWTVWWNGESVNQGAANVTTQVNFSNEFTATWSMTTIGGATYGLPVTWTINGYVSAVPVPAAVWLFGSGILCLAGFLRRGKHNV